MPWWVGQQRLTLSWPPSLGLTLVLSCVAVVDTVTLFLYQLCLWLGRWVKDLMWSHRFFIPSKQFWGSITHPPITTFQMNNDHFIFFQSIIIALFIKLVVGTWACVSLLFFFKLYHSTVYTILCVLFYF